jgi:hypothetical protein
MGRLEMDGFAVRCCIRSYLQIIYVNRTLIWHTVASQCLSRTKFRNSQWREKKDSDIVKVENFDLDAGKGELKKASVSN